MPARKTKGYAELEERLARVLQERDRLRQDHHDALGMVETHRRERDMARQRFDDVKRDRDRLVQERARLERSVRDLMQINRELEASVASKRKFMNDVCEALTLRDVNRSLELGLFGSFVVVGPINLRERWT